MEVVSVNISQKKGTIKTPVQQIILTKAGITNDAHAGNWHRQVSLLAKESIEKFSQDETAKRKFHYGEFAENITSSGIDFAEISVKDLLYVGETILEVTQKGKECHGGACAIFQEIGKCVMPKEGIFARILQGGSIEKGAKIHHEKRPIQAAVITLSDRASSGMYTDRSGPAVEEKLELHFLKSQFSANIFYTLIPDDAAQLRENMAELLKMDYDIIITTGGTGLSENDITVDTIKPMLSREIPGIMESIRVKYSASIPSAVLSRSIAGMISKTLVFTLPGSVKAAAEYMDEITKTLDHALFTISSIDTHM